ncbi:MAG TPA: ABC transporter substrate-binding protein [Candidatus Nanopelagicales bacterium]|nr:ABC transporter substrate-binding protein [Candidatus Nanopelagicales bacterium]
MRRTRSTAGGKWGVIVVVVALLAGSCGTPERPTPSPPASPVTTAAPTASPAPAYVDTLTFGFVPGAHVLPEGAPSDFRQVTGGISLSQVLLWNLVQGSLYRFDARYGAVPDLADGPCEPQGDGTVVRCRLVETTFHDGTPVTADDVAFSYAVFMRETFFSPGLTGKLTEVRPVDDRTVDFVLTARDPTFLTSVLPNLPILPRHAVEAAYAALAAGTQDLEAAELTQLADTIDEEIARDPPVCSPRVGEVAALLSKVGVTLYREDFASATGTFDACAYLGIASGFIRQAGVAIGLTGLDAVAAAWQLLSIDWRPIGTGPYRLVSEDADGVHLEAWPGYHGGLAATRFIDFVPTNPDGSDLLNGTVDIFQFSDLGPDYKATAASHDVRVVTLPDVGFYGLTFNVRPGRRFADPALRRALQMCVNLPRDVDAATGGTGSPVYGPVLPASWADDPALPKPARDTAAARKLIEGAGWHLGADGIYARDGVRLGADIVVRANREERVKMADLIAFQARDCGMDLRSRPTSWDDIVEGFFRYPHNLPGTSTPFDLYLGGWSNNPDPADGMSLFASSNLTDATHPDGLANGNIMGFTDPDLDRLLEAASSTYDPAERTRLYREVQRELAAQLPMLFLWASTTTDVVRSVVATVDGPLDLQVPHWAWQPERMVVEVAAP